MLWCSFFSSLSLSVFLLLSIIVVVVFAASICTISLSNEFYRPSNGHSWQCRCVFQFQQNFTSVYCTVHTLLFSVLSFFAFSMNLNSCWCLQLIPLQILGYNMHACRMAKLTYLSNAIKMKRSRFSRTLCHSVPILSSLFFSFLVRCACMYLCSRFCVIEI